MVIGFLLLVGTLFSAPLAAAEGFKARDPLGDVGELEGWHGLEKAPGKGAEGEDVARLDLPGEAKFLYEAEEGEGVGWGATKGGFRRYDPAGDWWDWPVIAFDVMLPERETAAELTISLLTPGDTDAHFRRNVILSVAGGGWRTVYVSVDDFRLNDAVTPSYLGYVSGLKIEADYSKGEVDEILLANAYIQRGRTIGLTAPIKSKAGVPGAEIEYEVAVANCSEEMQAVSLQLKRDGGEVMVTTVEPGIVHLYPGDVRHVTVSATIPTGEDPGITDSPPQGTRERWRLKAIPNGRDDQAEELELIHVVRMQSPNIIHTEDKWEKIRELADNEDWAKRQAENRINNAKGWQPSHMDQTGQAWNAAQAWQLTRDKEFAEKVAEYFRIFADPQAGYPAVKDIGGTGTGGMVHIGGELRNLGRAYDAIGDAGVLSAEDVAKIEKALRMVLDYARRRVDHVGNHPLSGATGALFIALSLQDWEQVERFIEGPCGIEWQIRRGLMDDGWAVEVSSQYNTHVGWYLIRAGLALRPWGVEILENKFPAANHEDVETSSVPGEDAATWRHPRGGMYSSAWGGRERSYRQVRDVFDGLIPLLTEDGKNQYPAPSDRLLFHTGDLFQAVAVENKTRWSNPRFGGHRGYSEEDKERGYVRERHGYVLPIPEDAPPGGHMTDFTKPVRSRRFMAVTDDYVIVVDNARGEEEHTFNALYFFDGFSEFNDGADIEFVEERDKFDDSPLSAGQFISDCRFYEAQGPVKAHFAITDGLQADIYSIWPQRRGHVVGKSPGNRGISGFYSAGSAVGREADFVTLIELQEDTADRQVQSATAEGPGRIKVTLVDGRTHNWRVEGLDAEEDRALVSVQMVEESSEGELLRRDSTD